MLFVSNTVENFRERAREPTMIPAESAEVDSEVSYLHCFIERVSAGLALVQYLTLMH